MTDEKKLEKCIEQMENEVRVWDEEHDPETKEKLLLLTKIDIIIKDRIKELTNAQVWYIRSEIGKILTYQIAEEITENMRGRLYRANNYIINPIQTAINDRINSKYQFTHNELIITINRTYSEFESHRGEIMQYTAITDPLSKYLANKHAMEMGDKIMGNISDWKYDLLNLIESDIENLCGFSHGYEPDDETKNTEGE